MGFRFERWTLVAASLPAIRRHCPCCRCTRSFVCSERFRVNAQKKVLDVWLLYRCAACELTWKLPILERRAVTALDPSLRECFESNDRATAHRYARDAATLDGHAVVSDAADVRVLRRVETRDALRVDTIRFGVATPCRIRLDRLLASELNVARSEIHGWLAAGRLVFAPERASALARKIHDGQEVGFLDGLPDCDPSS